MEQEQSGHLTSIMKELSDIKASLAVNTSETANIKSSIGDIKSDIKDIKNDTVNRRELNESIEAVKKEFKDADLLIRGEVSPLKKFIYGLVGTLCLSVLIAILSLVVK